MNQHCDTQLKCFYNKLKSAYSNKFIPYEYRLKYADVLHSIEMFMQYRPIPEVT
jgi:hypothetical protein